MSKVGKWISSARGPAARRLAGFVALIALMSQAQAYPGYGKSAPPATEPLVPVAATQNTNAAIEQLIPKISVEVSGRVQLFDAVNGKPRLNDYWWPAILDVSQLQRDYSSNPLGADFSYPKAFKKLNWKAVRADMRSLLKNSQDWWPADYGTYGPFFIRMSWHSSGTYRALDGRGGSDGGQQRFEPLNSWPDNANLDKSRRLIQPLVDKYYPNLSWADAMILAGDEAMRDMGFKTLGVAGGRTDDWMPDLVYWGPEDKFLESKRFDKNGKLILPLAASVMGLIYVNPEGADGKPDPLLSADHIRQTFGRMGMNDEETVALIAGGHTFGKAHGAHEPEKCLEAPVPADSPIEDQQLGWRNRCGKGHSEDTVTSGIEGAWTSKPMQWTHEYLTLLYKYDWTLKKGPGGKFQWFAKDLEPQDHAPNAHLPERAPIMMLTTDLSLKFDPKYRAISTRFLNNPKEFEKAFAEAWFKLIHRDLGPKTRYLGSDFPAQDFLWQDPVTRSTASVVSSRDIADLKKAIVATRLPIKDLIKTAWAGAVSYRKTDMKGGINGARLRLAPQKDWEVNEPQILSRNLQTLEVVQDRFNRANKSASKRISFADLLVIAGNVGVEEAAKKAGVKIELPFQPGRADATQTQTDVAAFQNLKVTSDGFRNYYAPDENYLTPAAAFVERADLLDLTIPEMTVLTGGMRVLGANYAGTKHGVFTQNQETLSNDFFINLMDQSTTWKLDDRVHGIFVGTDRKTGQQKWTATTHDLIFGSRSELRAVAFAYANRNAKTRFVHDFAKAWTKVMNSDRFDLKEH